MSNIKRSSRGFTIVELLIVIVVIAILAAIVVVAYNGVSQRARNSARASAAQQLYKAVHVAVASAGASEVGKKLEESGQSWHRSCLGTGLPTVGGKANTCAAYNGSSYAWGVNDFFTFMGTYSSVPSMKNFPAVNSTDGDVLYAPYLERGDVSGSGVTLPDALIIEYYLEGTNQDCVLRPIVKSGVINNSVINTASGSGVTECMIFVAYTGLLS
jgi:prepilin-type N-terminal cleavage/methylation domain-containing protein